MQNKPKLTLKIELAIPNDGGAPAQKFAVNRPLKAKWHNDPQLTTEEVLNEIKNYRGSFIGDLVHSMSYIVQSEDKYRSAEQERDVDVTKWTAALIEALLYSGIYDGLCDEQIHDKAQIVEWDGDVRPIESITQHEVLNIDIDKLLILLAPKIKHVVQLIAKKTSKVTDV